METLKDLVDARGLRYTWVAERLRLHTPALNRILNGTQSIPADAIEPLANMLQVDLSVIVRIAAQQVPPRRLYNKLDKP